MQNRKKLLLVINWKEEGKWDLLKDLKKVLRNVDVIQPFSATFFQRGKRRKLNIYLSEFYLPLTALLKSHKYNVIISWSMRIGIIYGLLNRMFRLSQKAKHIIYDFHVNLDRKDLLYRVKLFITKVAVKGIDFFLTTSTAEEKIYSSMFGIPEKRIKFFPIAAPKHFFDYSRELGSYIFSYGNSDRDYDTLVEAVKNLSVELIILSQTYIPKSRLPKNVQIITKPHYGIDLINLILGSRMVVLPLVSANVSAGQTALLESMALGRTVIVTRNMATEEYGEHGKSLFFYEAGNVKQLRDIINSLYHNSQLLEEIGKKARESICNIPEIRTKILHQIYHKLQNMAMESD